MPIPNPATYTVPPAILETISAKKPWDVVAQDGYGENNDATQELLLNLLWGGGRVADSLMSAHMLKQPGAYESNPISRKVWEKGGLPGFLALDALTTAGTYGASRLIDKNLSPTMAKIMPILGTLLQGVVLYKNSKNMKKYGW